MQGLSRKGKALQAAVQVPAATQLAKLGKTRCAVGGSMFSGSYIVSPKSGQGKGQNGTSTT